MPDNQNSSDLVQSLIQLRDATWTLTSEAMPDDAQGVLNMAIEAIRKPAPAMLNGVEARIQRDIEMHGYAEIMQHDFDALRAADNRDAAGVAPKSRDELIPVAREILG